MKLGHVQRVRGTPIRTTMSCLIKNIQTKAIGPSG